MCMQAVEGGVCILAAFLCCECRSLEVGGHMVCVCVWPPPHGSSGLEETR